MNDEAIYKSCSEIPIKNFFDLLDTGDLVHLLKKPRQLNESEKKDLFDTFNDIVLEYHELTKNDKFVQQKKAEFDIEYLEFRYNLTKEIIRLYSKNKNIEFFNQTVFNYKFKLRENEDNMYNIYIKQSIEELIKLLKEKEE